MQQLHTTTIIASFTYLVHTGQKGMMLLQLSFILSNYKCRRRNLVFFIILFLSDFVFYGTEHSRVGVNLFAFLFQALQRIYIYVFNFNRKGIEVFPKLVNGIKIGDAAFNKMVA